MAEGLNYTLGLEDHLSGPAHAEKESLKALEGQIEKTEKALRALRKEQLLAREAGDKTKAKGLGFQAAHLGLDLGAAKSELAKLKKEEGEGLLSIIGEHLAKGVGGTALLAGGLAAVGFAAATAIEKLGELGVESVKFAIEAAEFKHNTEIAYTAVKGTAAEGEEAFKEIDKLSRAVHLPAETAHKLASDLMLQGLESTKAIGGVIAADAALMRTGQEQGAEKLKMIVERSLASGHFDPGRLGGSKGGEASGRALAGLGVHLPDLIKDIAARTGDSIDLVKQKLKQGKIDTEVGIAALTDAIGKGAIGKAAQQKYDFGDFFTDVQNKWRSIVQDIDLGPIEQGLTDISYAINGIDGASAKSAIQTVVDAIGETITQATIFGLTVENVFLQAELDVKPFTDALGFANDEMAKLSGHGLAFNALTAVLPGPIANILQGAVAPANAGGGEVMAPAPGEMFASVAPGEFIVPEDQMGKMGGGDTGRSISIDVGGLHFTGPVDHTNIIPLLESQLADVLERVSLEMGR